MSAHTGFVAELLTVAPTDRDAWLDRRLGLTELPDDGPALPKDGVAYLPCPVDRLLALVQHLPIDGSDVLIDLGSGAGRAAAFVHLATGVRTIGIEVQPHLVRLARALPVAGLEWAEGDVLQHSEVLERGSIFFLYCPFNGPRLSQVLQQLERIAATKRVWVCTVDLPLPKLGWLELESTPVGGLEIHRSHPLQ